MTTDREQAKREEAIEKLDPNPEGPEEKGKPEAVNLEREEPVTTAARRRDSF